MLTSHKCENICEISALFGALKSQREELTIKTFIIFGAIFVNFLDAHRLDIARE